MQVVKARFRVVDARQLRQNHEVVVPLLEACADFAGDAVEMPIPFDSGAAAGYVDLTGKDGQAAHERNPVIAFS